MPSERRQWSLFRDALGIVGNDGEFTEQERDALAPQGCGGGIGGFSDVKMQMRSIRVS